MSTEEPHPSLSPRPEIAGSITATPAGVEAILRPPEERERRLLEARLTRMENYLGFGPLSESDAEVILKGGEPAPQATVAAPVEGTGLEMQIGEYWLARVGVLALSVGLAFLVAYPFKAFPAFLSCLIGYAAAAAFFATSRRWKATLPDASHILYGGALFLFYFATLRIHFFSSEPVVSDPIAGLALLVLAVGLELFLTVRRKSELMTGLVFVIGAVSATLSDNSTFQLGFMVVLAWVAYLLARNRGWTLLAIAVAALAYLNSVDWLLNNPLLGHTLRGAESSHWNMLAMAAYSVPFAALGCRPGAGDDHVAIRVGRALLTIGGVMLVTLINVALFYASAAPWVEVTVAAGLLVTAFAYWRHHQSVYATSIYACAGYMMLSFAIYRYFQAPNFYAWLAWQSLLVVVTAVWFRSKIVVVANLFIFGGIYLVYLFQGEEMGPVSLSFAIVALLTARVLNWKKDRLDLRTELMRNLYLGAATVVIPYGLYHTVPKGWVSVSWMAVAIVYFVTSAILGNSKYRLMGITTILATIIYVFVVDLARLEAAYRIVSFLVLGVVLLGLSIAYARRRRQSRPESAPVDPK